jgi:hypothetical protein
MALHQFARGFHTFRRTGRFSAFSFFKEFIQPPFRGLLFLGAESGSAPMPILSRFRQRNAARFPHVLSTVVGDIPGSHDFQGCARESSRNRQFVLRHPRTNGHRVIDGDVFTFSRIVSIHDPRGGCTLPRSGGCVSAFFFSKEIHHV